jgi:hypothetical protein
MPFYLSAISDQLSAISLQLSATGSMSGTVVYEQVPALTALIQG